MSSKAKGVTDKKMPSRKASNVSVQNVGERRASFNQQPATTTSAVNKGSISRRGSGVGDGQVLNLGVISDSNQNRISVLARGAGVRTENQQPHSENAKKSLKKAFAREIWNTLEVYCFSQEDKETKLQECYNNLSALTRYVKTQTTKNLTRKNISDFQLIGILPQDIKNECAVAYWLQRTISGTVKTQTGASIANSFLQDTARPNLSPNYNAIVTKALDNIWEKMRQLTRSQNYERIKDRTQWMTEEEQEVQLNMRVIERNGIYFPTLHSIAKAVAPHIAEMENEEIEQFLQSQIEFYQQSLAEFDTKHGINALGNKPEHPKEIGYMYEYCYNESKDRQDFGEKKMPNRDLTWKEKQNIALEFNILSTALALYDVSNELWYCKHWHGLLLEDRKRQFPLDPRNHNLLINIFDQINKDIVDSKEHPTTVSMIEFRLGVTLEELWQKRRADVNEYTKKEYMMNYLDELRDQLNSLPRPIFTQSDYLNSISLINEKDAKDVERKVLQTAQNILASKELLKVHKPNWFDVLVDENDNVISLQQKILQQRLKTAFDSYEFCGRLNSDIAKVQEYQANMERLESEARARVSSRGQSSQVSVQQSTGPKSKKENQQQKTNQSEADLIRQAIAKLQKMAKQEEQKNNVANVDTDAKEVNWSERDEYDVLRDGNHNEPSLQVIAEYPVENRQSEISPKVSVPILKQPLSEEKTESQFHPVSSPTLEQLAYGPLSEEKTESQSSEQEEEQSSEQQGQSSFQDQINDDVSTQQRNQPKEVSKETLAERISRLPVDIVINHLEKSVLIETEKAKSASFDEVSTPKKALKSTSLMSKIECKEMKIDRIFDDANDYLCHPTLTNIDEKHRSKIGNKFDLVLHTKDPKKATSEEVKNKINEVLESANESLKTLANHESVQPLSKQEMAIAILFAIRHGGLSSNLKTSGDFALKNLQEIREAIPTLSSAELNNNLLYRMSLFSGQFSAMAKANGLLTAEADSLSGLRLKRLTPDFSHNLFIQGGLTDDWEKICKIINLTPTTICEPATAAQDAYSKKMISPTRNII